MTKKHVTSGDLSEILPILEKEVAGYSVPVVDLIATQTKDPYKVLVATILSSRTRDETTAKAAARLFAKAPDPGKLARLGEKEISKLIYPVGFYRNKARHLAALPGVLLSSFDGLIPDRVEDLVKLPGVGRKTANLVVAVAFGKPAICVDTHVHRIMNIWGYVKTKTPEQTEVALRQKLPEKYWLRINAILVAFGQGTCKPVWPHCDRCVILKWCPQIGVTPRKTPGSRNPKNNTRTLLSWNVNGLRAVAQKGFVELVEDLSPDVLCLQEIKAQPEQLSDELLHLKGYNAFWFPAERKGYGGICTYSKRDPLAVTYGMDIIEHDREGRVLTLEFDDFFLVNVYFPNAQHGLKRLDYKLQFNRDLLVFVGKLANRKSTVICGDFNVAHKDIDLTNPRQNEKNPGFTAQERAWMDDFLAAGFVDTFRIFNKDPGHYTWWSYRFNARAKNIGWRIDYFCVDSRSVSRVKNASILNEVTGSDHCPVSIEFK